MNKVSLRIAMLFVVASSISLSNLHAQEQVPQKELFKYAIGLGFAAFNEKDLAFKSMTDASKSSAVHKEDQVAVLLPNQEFSEDLFNKVNDKEVTPFGQLWLRDIVPQIDGKPIAPDKLRTVTMDAGKEKITAHLCLLGFQKNDKGETQLILYGKGKSVILKPVLTARDEKQDQPLLIGMQAPADKPMLVTISLFDKHRAEFEVAPAPVK